MKVMVRKQTTQDEVKYPPFFKFKYSRWLASRRLCFLFVCLYFLYFMFISVVFVCLFVCCSVVVLKTNLLKGGLDSEYLTNITFLQSSRLLDLQ